MSKTPLAYPVSTILGRGIRVGGAASGTRPALVGSPEFQTTVGCPDGFCPNCYILDRFTRVPLPGSNKVMEAPCKPVGSVQQVPL
jgi:hypothetical protein